MKLETALHARLARLSELSSVISASAHLTPGDRSTLTADVASEEAGIGAILRQVPGDSTCGELRNAARQMIVNYRVYVVMAPQVRLTIADDDEVAIGTVISRAITRVQGEINGSSNQTGVAAARASLAAAENQAAAAGRDSAGISATVLLFTPSSYPDCWSSFLSARTSLREGLVALRAARADLRAAIAALQ
ncbi:MAG: hypothetical protein M0Z95_29280 [Actinomycetota bacterium]|nr:hypothetical protein [Actinomycetota bacterium]